MNKKLNYKYNDNPHTYYKHSDPHFWGQELNFRIELTRHGKKHLLKDRSKLVRDVSKLFYKYGIDTETFNVQNEWI